MGWGSDQSETQGTVRGPWLGSETLAGLRDVALTRVRMGLGGEGWGLDLLPVKAPCAELRNLRRVGARMFCARSEGGVPGRAGSGDGARRGERRAVRWQF